MHTIILANYTGHIAVVCPAFLAHTSAHPLSTVLRTETTELSSKGLHGYIAGHAECRPCHVCREPLEEHGMAKVMSGAGN